MNSTNSSIGSSSGVDPYTKAHSFVQSIALTLQQNSFALLNNSVLKTETLNSLSDLVQNALETAKITPAQFVSNPQSFTDPSTLCIALTVLLKSERKIENELREEVAVAKEENKGLQDKIASIQKSYDSLISEIKQLQAQPANQKQPADLKAQIADANERIKLQAQRNSEEVSSLKNQIQELKDKLKSADAELVQAQSDALKQKRESDEKIQLIADAFEVSETTSAESILAEIKAKLGIPEKTENVFDALAQKIRQGAIKYTQILSKFSVPENTENAAADIRSSVEGNYKKAILAKLHSLYYFSKNINDIVKAVQAIAGEEGVVSELISTFQLPEDTTNQNVVDAIKEKINETTIALDENQTLKAENESLKEEAKKNQMLIDLMNEEPVVYEVMPEEQEPEQEVVTREIEEEEEDEEKENLIRIENISNELEEAQKSLKEYEAILQANQERIQELAQEKEKAVADAKKEARRRYKSKISELSQLVDQLIPNEEMIKNLKKQIKHLQRQDEKSRAKITEIETQLQNEVSVRASVEAQLESTTQQLQSYADENTHLSQVLEQTQTAIFAAPQEEENPLNGRVQQIVDDANEQLTSTLEELASETKQRNQLINIVNKQQQVMLSLEKLVQEKTTEAANALQSTKVEQLSPDQIVNEDTYIESLVDVDKEGIQDEIQDVLQIAKKNETNKEKCIRIVQYLLGRISENVKQQEALRQQIDSFVDKQPIVDKLLVMLNQQLAFVERIACSNDKAITEETRNQMIENAARTHAFLTENCIGFTEDRSLFDLLGINADPLELKNGIQKLFGEYQDIESPEGLELLIVLRQAIAAALVLQRYASEAQQQCDRNANEIKILKSDMCGFRAETEALANQRIKECEEKIKESENARKNAEAKIANFEKILRNNITNDELYQPIERCLDELREGAEFEIDDEDYQASVQKEIVEKTKQIQAITKELEETKNELTELRETTAREIEEIQNESGALGSEAQELIQKQNEEIAQIKTELEETKSALEESKKDLDAITTEYEEVQKKNEELQKEVQEEQKRAEEAEAAKEAEISKIKEKADAKLNKAIKLLATEQKAQVDKMQSRIKAIQKQLNKRNAEVQEKDEIIKTQMESQSQLDLSKTQAEEELREVQQQNEVAIQQLRAQLQDAVEKANASDLEKKLLQSRLKTAEDKAERNASHFESQLALKKFAADAEAQQKIEALTDEFNEKTSAFLRDICNIFTEHVDLTIPMTQPNVIRMLENVAQEMKLAQRNVEKAEDFERQIKEIRVLLNASKGIRTTAAVSDFIEANKQVKQRNADLEQQLKEHVLGADSKAAEWEEWGRKLYYSISQGTQQPATSQKLRLALEEALFSSTANSAIPSKIEFLRTQKRFLAQGEMPMKSEAHGDEPVSSLLPIICAFMFIRRTQKLSHHIPSEISFNGGKKDEEEQNENISNEEHAEEEEVKNVPKETKSISALFGQSVLH